MGYTSSLFGWCACSVHGWNLKCLYSLIRPVTSANLQASRFPLLFSLVPCFEESRFAFSLPSPLIEATGTFFSSPHQRRATEWTFPPSDQIPAAVPTNDSIQLDHFGTEVPFLVPCSISLRSTLVWSALSSIACIVSSFITTDVMSKATPTMSIGHPR